MFENKQSMQIELLRNFCMGVVLRKSREYMAPHSTTVNFLSLASHNIHKDISKCELSQKSWHATSSLFELSRCGRNSIGITQWMQHKLCNR